MIAVQPPGYFPPLAYMALLGHVDHFILADTFHYRSKTFQNRSKLRNAQGAHWITIPLFGRPEGAPICSVDIETGGRWREKHWRSFMYDYRTTMYFEFYEDRFRPFFDVRWENLGDCTCRCVELQADLYGLDTQITRTSSLDGAPQTRTAILDAIGGETLAVSEEERPVDVEEDRVVAVQYDHPTYHQNFEGFETGMSAMDLLFNYGREAPRYLSNGLRTVKID